MKKCHGAPGAVSWIVFFLVAACGGKTVLEAPADGDRRETLTPGSPSGASSGAGEGTSIGGSVGRSGSSLPGSTSPTPPPPTIRDDREACEIVCERHVRCVGVYPDCLEVCRQDGLDDACGHLAKTWNRCFAEHVAQANCTHGPPVCRDTYCAYLACRAPERVSVYCK
jgi:hypothetical protein